MTVLLFAIALLIGFVAGFATCLMIAGSLPDPGIPGS